MVEGHCTDENDESRIGSKGKRTQKPVSRQSLPLPQYHLSTKLSCSKWDAPHPKKLTRARQEDKEVWDLV